MPRPVKLWKGCRPRKLTKPDGEVFLLLEPEYYIAEKHWRELCLRNGPLVEHQAANSPWTYQGPQNSCCASMGAHGMALLNFREGEANVLLSQATIYHWEMDRYGRIVERTQDNGMEIGTCGLLLEEFGLCTAEEIDPLDWRGRNWPDDWKRRAKRHRLTERFKDLPDMNAIMSMLCHPFPIAHGYAGHARLIVRALFEKPGTRPTRFLAKNSHKSAPWHWLTWSQVESGVRGYGAFAFAVSVAG